ncbi:MAG: hypothetical protein IKQ88_08250 [Lachnospiraceae bacterium]|nr:hypothetical protein [Lachnospiraceae bacterium]
MAEKKEKTSSSVLYRTLLKNSEMSMPEKGAKGNIYRALGVIAVSCIMLPCCAAMGFISYMLSASMFTTEGLKDASGAVINGIAGNGILTMLHVLSVFSLVFSLLVIFNVLFFSEDLKHLIPLPFKPEEILKGRFMHTYVAESIMEFMILIAVFAGYFAAAGLERGTGFWLKPVQILAAVSGIVLTPLLPLIYCVFISFILMLILKKVRNRRVFNQSSTVVMMFFILLFLFSLKGEGTDADTYVYNYIDSLAGGNNMFFIVCNRLFFTTPFLMDALVNGSLSSLCLYLSLNTAVTLFMFYVCGKLYPECLYRAAALAEKKKASDIRSSAFKPASVFKAYVLKELKTLVRTRAYASNCFNVNFLWPVGVFILFRLTRENEGMVKFREMFESGEYARAQLIMLIAVTGISFVASAMNSLASTAFTREGSHVDIVKYLPVDFKLQLRVKFLVSVFLTWPMLILSVIVSALFLKMSVIRIIYYCVLSGFAVVLCSVTGLLLDSAAPYTDWSDEYSALRGNLNSFFNMAVAMLLAVFLCALEFLLFELIGLNLAADEAAVLVLLALLAAAAVLLGKKRILKNMSELY